MASDGESTEFVSIEWLASSGADAYRIYRNGAQLVEVTGLAHDDVTAAAPGAPLAPSGFAATDGNSTENVTLTWSAAIAPDGAEHEYSVSALKGSDESDRSDADTGYRAALPVSDYVVFRDGVALATVTGILSYADATAAVPESPTAPTNLLASDGTETSKVVLTWAASTVAPGASHQYAVRAVSAAGDGALSPTDAGFRGEEAIEQYEVLRDAVVVAQVTNLAYDDAGADAAGVPGAPQNVAATDGGFTSKVAVTWTAPSMTGGTIHDYTVRAVSGAGTSSSSASDSGFRKGLPIQNYQILRDGVQIAEVDNATFMVDDSGATAGGVPATPTNFSASSDQFVDRVELTWDSAVSPDGATHTYGVRAVSGAGTGATETNTGFRAGFPVLSYSITRDSSPLAVTSSLSHSDTTANAAGTPAAPQNLVASQNDPAEVRVSWDNASVPGTSHAYTIRATNSAGSSVLAAGDSGSRVGFPVHHYTVLRDGVSLGDVMAVSFDDTGAIPGSVPTAPAGFAASNGTFTDRVALSWLASGASPGPSHDYDVFAVNSAGNGGIASDSGNRAVEPITAYEVSLDQANWSSLGLVLSADDFGAAAGTLRNGAATATQGSSALDVSIEATSTGADPTTGATYFLRAVNLQGPGPSSSDAGFRGVGAISFQWERSAGDADSNYSPLAGATTVAFLDDRAPANADGRYYRLKTSATAAATATSNAPRGFRSYLPLPQETLRSDFWVTDYVVHAMVQSNGVLYIGGEFKEIGPPTGAFVSVDEVTGLADPGPRVLGGVAEAISDGQGGWYIAGDLRSIGSVATVYKVARILADGSVDTSFAPVINNAVGDLALDNGVLYISGGFTTVNGQPRNRIAALNASTGALLPWNPNPIGDVYEILVSGSTVYVGGSFTSIGGQTRNRLASLSTSTGLASSWNPNLNNYCGSLALSGGVLYAGGGFTSVGSFTRNRLVAFDQFGDVTAWNPNANGDVAKLLVNGSTVYLAGQFTTVGGITRNRLASVDLSSAAVLGFDPNADASTQALAVSGSAIYVGGSFTNVGGQAQRRFAALDATTGAALPISWPNASASVETISVSGGKVFAGGGFDSVGTILRERLAAIDITTGEPTAWDPGANDRVYSLQVKDDVVYVGGEFTTIDGQARNRLAAIDATGAVTSFNPNVNNTVRAIAVGDSVVYFGGSFTNVGGNARQGLAAADLSGIPTGWNPAPSGGASEIVLSGSTVYVSGGFGFIGGQSRNGLAALDASTGNATSWNPSQNGTIYDLEVDAGVAYIAGTFTSAGGQPRNKVAALSTTTGLATSFNPNANFECYAMALSGDVFYVAGVFSTIAGQPRNRVAAFQLSTGSLLSWTPQPGVYPSQGLVTVGDQLFIGEGTGPWLQAFDPY